MPNMPGPRNQPASSLNERQARYILIDPALRAAGWNLEDRTQVGFEIPVDGYEAAPWNGVTNYCLYAPGGEVIAVVGAKRWLPRTKCFGGGSCHLIHSPSNGWLLAISYE